MTYIKTYVPAYEDIITWSTIDIVNRFRKYDVLIGDENSIEYINNTLKKYYEEN
tara:strand:+ start:969 stop:1130 length:162 start_codon:yes stop_codon:yes gene_type:complete